MSTPFQQPNQQVGGTGSGVPAGSSAVTVVNPPGGTVNQVPKWTAATVLGNSTISDTGVLVVIGSLTTIDKETAAPLNNVVTALQLLHGAPGGGQAGAGVRLELASADTNGATSIAGTVDGVFTTATAGAEVSEIRFSARSAGVLSLIQTISKAGITEAAPVTTTVTDTATVTTTDVMTMIHRTSGAAGIGFGAGLLYQLQNSTGTTKDAARIAVRWFDPVNATEDSSITFQTTIAGAALSDRVQIQAGMMIGSYAIATIGDQGNGTLVVGSSAGAGAIYIGSATTATGQLRLQQNGAASILFAALSSAATFIDAEVNTTAAGAVDRFRVYSIVTPTAGTFFSCVHGGGPTKVFAIGFGADIQQQFADTGAGLTGTVSNTPTGRSEFAVGTAVYQLVSNRCVAASRVRVTLETIQGATVLQGVVPAAGSFTVTITAVAAVAVIRFHWEIENNL